VKIRLVVLFVAALVGIGLAVLTKRNAPTSREPIAQSDNDAMNPDIAGASKVESPFGEDPGQRQAIASMRSGLVNVDSKDWLQSFDLTERSGETIDSEQLKGAPYIASFFFSKCPGSCKQQNNQMRLLQEKYRDTPIRLVSISVDPEADTPEVLSEYANSFGADKNKWLFFTGDIKYISKVAGEVFFLGQVGLKGHPDRFCLVDADGKLVGKYNWHEESELEMLDQHVKELLAGKPTASTESITPPSVQ
jgi:protein SCO1